MSYFANIMLDPNYLAFMAKAVTHAEIAQSNGEETVVSGVASKRIVCHQAALTVDSESAIQFKSGTTVISGPMKIFAQAGVVAFPGSSNGAVILPFTPAGWFMCAAGEDFKLNVTGGDVNGVIGYTIIDE